MHASHTLLERYIRFAAILEHFFNIVSTVVTLVVSFTLLYRTIGLAAIAPIVVTLGLSIIDGTR